MSAPRVTYGLPQDLDRTTLTWTELGEHLATIAGSVLSVYVRATAPGTTQGTFTHTRGALAVLASRGGDRTSYWIGERNSTETGGSLEIFAADFRTATLRTAKGDRHFSLCIQMSTLTITVFDTERLVRRGAIHGLPQNFRDAALTWSEMREHLAALVRSGLPIDVNSTGAQTVAGSRIATRGILCEYTPLGAEEVFFWVGERGSLDAGGGFGFTKAHFRGASLSTDDGDSLFVLGIDLVDMTIVLSETISL